MFSTVLVQSLILAVGGIWTADSIRDAQFEPVQTVLDRDGGITQEQLASVHSSLPGWPTVAWSLTAGVIMIGGLTMLASLALIRRYESRIDRVNRGLEREVRERIAHGLETRNALIFGLAKLADYRDTDTGRHLERIAVYCEILAERLAAKRPGIDRAWIEHLKLASSLHDIGKVGVPDSILLKPGPLTPAERASMQLHCAIGAETLRCIRTRLGPDPLIDMGIEVAMQHHERWDGYGYPAGISGEAIALSARIVALADFYDALTSQRVYKAARSHEETRAMILEQRGRHFDPDVVDAFESAHQEFDRVRQARRALAFQAPADAPPAVRAA